MYRCARAGRMDEAAATAIKGRRFGEEWRSADFVFMKAIRFFFLAVCSGLEWFITL